MLFFIRPLPQKRIFTLCISIVIAIGAYGPTSTLQASHTKRAQPRPRTVQAKKKQPPIARRRPRRPRPNNKKPPQKTPANQPKLRPTPGTPQKGHQDVPPTRPPQRLRPNPSKENPVFAWVVTHPNIKGKVYLVGSMHTGKASFYPLHPVIEHAFAESDALAVEVNIAAIYSKTKVAFDDFMNTQAVTYSFWPLVFCSLLAYILSMDEVLALTWQGQLLATFALILASMVSNMLERGKAQSQLLQRAFRILNLPFYHRFFVNFFMSSSQIRFFLREKLRQQIAGFLKFGREWYFIEAAKKANKRILELESVEIQHEMQAQIREKPFFATLKGFLEDFSLLENNYKKIVQGLHTGNSSLLYESLLYEKERMVNFEKLMLIDRNIAMTKKIKLFIQTDRIIFILVGAMHYVGPHGILALLKKDGYIIEQLYN